jgi:hypothetical protein
MKYIYTGYIAFNICLIFDTAESLVPHFSVFFVYLLLCLTYIN